MKINVAFSQNKRVHSSKFKVPKAFTVKSVIGSLAAQSWEGWAAVCTIREISVEYSENILLNDCKHFPNLK